LHKPISSVHCCSMLQHMVFRCYSFL